MIEAKKSPKLLCAAWGFSLMLASTFRKAKRIRRSRPEPESALKRVQEAIDHDTVVVGVIEDVNPRQIRRIGTPSQEPEVVHDDERLVDIGRVQLVALNQLPQDLRSGQRVVRQPRNPPCSTRMPRQLHRLQQFFDISGRIVQGRIIKRLELLTIHELLDVGCLIGFQVLGRNQTGVQRETSAARYARGARPVACRKALVK